RREQSISSDERHAFLLAIEQAGDHLEVVIDHLLEMDSLETGVLTLELSAVNLVQLLREVVSAAERCVEAEQGVAARRLRFHLEGLGIAAEHVERIFDPFYRVDTRLAREVNGLGIGLANCKRIVELHGGAIWVESTVGTGSTFHVRLPRGRSRTTSTKRERK